MFSSNTSQVSQDAVFIEDVMSTFLYTGNGSTQTITNGIDLAGEGGLVWCKARTTGGLYHTLTDTATGASKALFSNSTSSQLSGNYVTAFGATGFSIGNNGYLNYNNEPTVSWTFRKQPKFFDVVTYTGNGTGNRQIAHNLGSVPGCIIIKAYSGGDSGTDPWIVYHRSTGNTQALYLNQTDAALTSANWWNNTSPTDTNFTVNTSSYLNQSGEQYVAYLFAHDSGGFGLSGEDNVISCGSFTTDGSGIIPTVDLGYEPQWIMFKSATSADSWYMADNMRGWFNKSTEQFNGLRANLSNAEIAGFDGPILTSTGFTGPSVNFGASNTFIYIAIRRGPMKVPESGTSVFSPNAQNTGTTPLVTTNFPVDLSIGTDRTGASRYVVDRLRGTTAASSQYLETNSTIAEAASGGGLNFANNTGFTDAFFGYSQSIFWNFRRAPGFFDEVCYTGDGTTGQAINHNLTVVPEFYVIKQRSSAGGDGWQTYWSVVPNPLNIYMPMNSSAARDTNTNAWQTPTSTQIKIGAGLAGYINASGQTYVAYLFASCPGVSKVGSYTGTAATLQIDCGFTTGARFVLIKKTSGTGSWYVWDSARGIVSGNDPYLLLNSTAAEVTSTDYVDTYSAGFEISSTAPSEINENGGSFIFFAVA